MKTLRILVLGCALFSAPAFAAAAGPSIFLASDSEGFVTKRIGGEYMREDLVSGASVGLRYRFHQFTQAAWTRDAQQLAFAAKGKSTPSELDWQGEAGLMSQGGRQLLTLDANVHAPLSTTTSLEAFVNRDYVETAAALDRGIAASFAGASLEQALNPHWTAVGVLGLQDFTDGNLRKHARLKLIWQPDLDVGLTLQLRHRYYQSGTSDVPGAYFNPDRYRESMLMLGYRKRGKEWRANVLAGVGRQRVANDASTPTGMLEAAFETRLSQNQSLALRAGLNRSASFGGPDYRYRYLQASLNVRF